MPISQQTMQQTPMNSPNNSMPKQQNSLGQLIGQYNSYGHKLRSELSMRELAEELMQIAEFAEQAIMSEADDWFDGHTIKRNMKEMKGYVNEFNKIALEYDGMRQRATALYDDMGRVLERYFEIQDNDQESFKYDTDGDGLPDMQPGNAPKNPVDAAGRSKMAHESDELVNTPSDEDHNRELIDRLLKLARHRLTGEQLVRFDTLQKETQIKAAWRIVR